MKDPMPLELKTDMTEVAKRWDAYFAGEIIDRPLVWVTAPVDNPKPVEKVSYYDWIYGDIDENIDRVLEAARQIYWGGEAVPSFYPSFGCDEVGVYTGSKLIWNENSSETNWIIPYVESWEDVLPLEIKDDNYYWKRKLEIYRRGAEKLAGIMAMCPLDFHSNMGMLAAIRSGEKLCMDLYDSPELIDRAMESARALFPKMWQGITEAGKMYELGFCQYLYSMEGACSLECDFSCMISPEMFKRWVLPALEEEATYVKNVVYHWDGVGALPHKDALIESENLYTLAFLPGAGNGTHLDYVDLLKEIQQRGKAVHAGGTTVDDIKQLHKELDPTKVAYFASVGSQAEAEELLEWFVNNT